MIKDIIADHFSGNPQAGCRVIYPISRLYSNLPKTQIDLSICQCAPNPCWQKLTLVSIPYYSTGKFAATESKVFPRQKGSRVLSIHLDLLHIGAYM